MVTRQVTPVGGWNSVLLGIARIFIEHSLQARGCAKCTDVMPVYCAVATIITPILKMRKLRLRDYWGRDSLSIHQNPLFPLSLHMARPRSPASLQLGVAM